VGVICAARAFGKDVLAPLVTLGSGFVDSDGTLVVTSCPDTMLATLNDLAKKKGIFTTPLA
jgi:hypothetical protein